MGDMCDMIDGGHHTINGHTNIGYQTMSKTIPSALAPTSSTTTITPTTSSSHMMSIDFPPLISNSSNSNNQANSNNNGHPTPHLPPLQLLPSTVVPLSAAAALAGAQQQSTRSHEEEIYEDLCYVTLRLGRDRDRVLGTCPLEPIEKRDYCVKELVETEKNYCDALNMICQQFLQPLSKLLRTQDRQVIFMHMKHLCDVHSRFYQDLCHACQAPGAQCQSSSSLLLQQQSSHTSLTSTTSCGIPLSNTSTMTAGSSPTTGLTTIASASSIASSVVTVNGVSTQSISGVSINNFRISSSFIQFKDKFIVYGDYCANLPRAQSLIDELCQKDEQIVQAVQKCQMKANDGKFKLRDLLSLPMQRILKYHLLLSQLIKTTSDTHDDYQGLQRAHASMVDLGQYINEVKRDTETLGIIKDIQASITDLDMPDNTELRDYGRLLKDGELRIRSHDDNRLKNRYVFVFDKVMLMCKSIRGEQYSYKEALILADYQIEEQCMASTISKLTKQWTCGWNLVHRQHKKTYAFYAKTDDLRHKWIDAINKALDNDCPLACREGYTDHTFAMHTFPCVTICQSCDKLLKGVFFQGYQCTVCHTAVHKECIQQVPSCGAPTLPPRPPLPPSSPGISLNSFNDEDSLCNGLPGGGGEPTGLRLSYESPVALGVADCHQQAAQEALELNLDTYDWYAGSMDRETAQTVLEPMQQGSFLVRISPKQRGSYAISLNYAGQVKHMRVQQTQDHQHYYLSESRYFRTIVDLVIYYQVNSLCESFNLVDTSLSVPYRRALNATPERSGPTGGLCSPTVMTLMDASEFGAPDTDSPLPTDAMEGATAGTSPTNVPTFTAITGINDEPVGYAVALYVFEGQSANLLDLSKGDRVAILSKAGESKGWWKGRIDDRVGYFPLAYVSQTPDIL